MALPSAVEKFPNTLPTDIEVLVSKDIPQARPAGKILRNGFVKEPADSLELEEVLFIGLWDRQALAHKENLGDVERSIHDVFDAAFKIASPVPVGLIIAIPHISEGSKVSKLGFQEYENPGKSFLFFFTERHGLCPFASRSPD